MSNQESVNFVEELESFITKYDYEKDPELSLRGLTNHNINYYISQFDDIAKHFLEKYKEYSNKKFKDVEVILDFNLLKEHIRRILNIEQGHDLNLILILQGFDFYSLTVMHVVRSHHITISDANIKTLVCDGCRIMFLENVEGLQTVNIGGVGNAKLKMNNCHFDKDCKISNSGNVTELEENRFMGDISILSKKISLRSLKISNKIIASGGVNKISIDNCSFLGKGSLECKKNTKDITLEIGKLHKQEGCNIILEECSITKLEADKLEGSGKLKVSKSIINKLLIPKNNTIKYLFQEVQFDLSPEEGRYDFSRKSFKGKVDFSECTFVQEVTFKGTTFHQVSFESATFYDNVYLECNFEKIPNLKDTVFGKQKSISRGLVEKLKEYRNRGLKSWIYPFHQILKDHETNPETFITLREYYKEKGDHDHEFKAFQHEMILRKEGAKEESSGWRWNIYRDYELLSEYGGSVLRVVVAIIAIFLISGGLYTVDESINWKEGFSIAVMKTLNPLSSDIQYRESISVALLSLHSMISSIFLFLLVLCIRNKLRIK